MLKGTTQRILRVNLLQETYSCCSPWEDAATEQSGGAVTWSVILSPHSIAARVWRDDLLAQWGSPLFSLKMAQLLHPRGDKEQVEENGTLSGHCPYVGSRRGSIKKEKHQFACMLLPCCYLCLRELLTCWEDGRKSWWSFSPLVWLFCPSQLLSCH